MSERVPLIERRTSADVVYDALYERIGSLGLLPNAKISEAEIAAEFGVSRQPVRDAFSRLGNVGFVTVRPQKATLVRPFSLSAIRDARFVRLSIEVEIVRRLAASADGDALPGVDGILERQAEAAAAGDVAAFHQLDNAFHRALCDGAGYPGAGVTICEMKVQVDRLCKLSLAHGDEMAVLLEDHRRIVAAIEARDAAEAAAALRTHLARLDRAIAEVRASHPDYFAA